MKLLIVRSYLPLKLVNMIDLINVCRCSEYRVAPLPGHCVSANGREQKGNLVEREYTEFVSKNRDSAYEFLGVTSRSGRGFSRTVSLI